MMALNHEEFDTLCGSEERKRKKGRKIEAMEARW